MVLCRRAGQRTHTHFDSDHNLFIQLRGRKRFVMWAPNQSSLLCPFPRLHPLWHKSQVHFEEYDRRVRQCARYVESEAVVVDVGPGDVLYVPPFWWHTVETLEPSLSLSTLSRYVLQYNIMNGIYSLQYHFDKLRYYPSKWYALRAFFYFLSKAMDETPSATSDDLSDSSTLQHIELSLIRRVRHRYQHLEGQFPAALFSTNASQRCVLDLRGTPTCRQCAANGNSDASLVWRENLVHLPPDIRETLLLECFHLPKPSDHCSFVKFCLSEWG